MYYCKSRYYVPAWDRWLNADNPSFLDFQGFSQTNLFSYCGNDPVNMVDSSGSFAISAFLLLLISLAILSSDSKKEGYKDTGYKGEDKYTLRNGKEIYYNITYNEIVEKSNLKVYNSFQYTSDEINEFLDFLKQDPRNSSINKDKVRNEWIYHNIAYDFGINQNSTASVDVFFNHDDEGHGALSWIMNNIVIF